MNYNTRTSRGGRGRHFSLLCIAICCLLFVMGLQANEPSEKFKPDFDNITSSTLFLTGPTEFHNAPLLDTTVDIAVSGIVAKVSLTQSFSNVTSEWVEGLYTFPLPDQAAVNSMVIIIGDRKIIGSIKEKMQAEAQYGIAKKAGKVASLVNQQRPNLFSSKISNIPPGETVSIKLSYVQTVPYDNHTYSLRIPLTLTPRYTNNESSITPVVHSPQVALSQVDTSTEIDHQVSINTILFGAYDASQIHSPSHGLAVVTNEQDTQIKLNQSAHLDRDFILQWRDTHQTTPLVQTWRETVADEEYLLATLTPPVSEIDIPRQARELILVIDTSGSMAGESLRAAKAALLDALQGLKSDDRFNIIEFNSDYRSLFVRPEEATDTHIDLAKQFTRNLQADGGTEMLGALQTALRYRNNELLRQVVFITDGAVDYEEQVFKSASDHLGNARLFTVGIGSAPNQWFMRKLAQTGRGTFQNVQNINDVQKSMSVLLRKLETPALTNITVSFDGDQPDITPAPFPDLYANEPVVIAAKLVEGNSTMRVAGTWGSEQWSTEVAIDSVPETDTGLSTVWAKRKIESLQDKQRFSVDTDLYRSLILRLSLDHQILSKYTAFLAIEEKPIRPVNDALVERAVPNLLPAGTTSQAFPLPQGSAGIDTLAALSALLMLLAIIFSMGHRIHSTRALNS